MNYQQVLIPQVNISCEPGWCLNYVQRAFGAGWAGSTATDGWNRSQFKHADSSYPAGVAVPVWFEMAGEPAGHVVVRMPDGSVYSTSHPTNKTPYQHPNMAHLMSYYGGRLTLRGWSEDLNGVRVIQPKEEDVKIENNSQWKTRMAGVLKEITGEDLSVAEFEAWVGAEPFGIVEALIDDKRRAAQNDSIDEASSKLQAIKDALK